MLDVRVDVEALICRCRSAFSACCLRDFAFQPLITVSSLILGEVESGDLGEVSKRKGLAPTRMSYPSEWILTCSSLAVRLQINNTRSAPDAYSEEQIVVEGLRRWHVAVILWRRFALPHASGGSVSSMQTLISPVCRGIWSSGQTCGFCPSRPVSLKKKRKARG